MELLSNDLLKYIFTTYLPSKINKIILSLVCKKWYCIIKKENYEFNLLEIYDTNKINLNIINYCSDYISNEQYNSLLGRVISRKVNQQINSKPV